MLMSISEATSMLIDVLILLLLYLRLASMLIMSFCAVKMETFGLDPGLVLVLKLPGCILVWTRQKRRCLEMITHIRLLIGSHQEMN